MRKGRKTLIVENIRQKFTISLTDHVLVITDETGTTLRFRPGEALMLLDILKNEEPELKRLAEEASPIPLRIRV